MPISLQGFTYKRRISYILVITALLLSGFIYAVLSQSSKQVIESHALIVAKIVAQHATIARSVYAKEIAGKLKADGLGPHVDSKSHKGYIPIPAQFLKLVGKAANEKSHNLFRYTPVSKWNIEPTQGLSDDFLVWAWEQLEIQDKTNPTEAIDWKPVWRFEKKNNTSMLRFLYPDPASAKSCATCHNAYEKKPDIIQRRKQQGVKVQKEWKQHQLLGALSITVPLDEVETIAQGQINRVTSLITITITISLLLIAWFTMRNVRQQSKLLDLDRQSTHDPLTGLLNRRAMRQLSVINWDKLENRNAVLLCAIDLDNFKPVNDKYGHKAGDKLLKKVAHELTKATRKDDYVFRLGGDEFFVVYTNSNTSQAKEKGNRLLKAVRSSTIQINGSTISISASIGIVELDPSENDYSKFMERADQASYEAKNRGRNQVVIH